LVKIYFDEFFKCNSVVPTFNATSGLRTPAVPLEQIILAQLELRTHAEKYEKKVYTLPKHLDEKVARLHLAHIGVELDTLTPEQAEYINVAVE